ncbi:MAG TPA: hypothetical protein VFN28_03670 [Amaricoccus sp.]|nr:hypothetical protein [Amaricoccus sp.]
MAEMRRPWLLLLLFAAAACGPAEEVVGRPTDAARNAPPPRLGETAAFDAALASAAPDAERLGAERDALAARAAALRARAAALAGPVVDPAKRQRLEPAPAPAAAP